LVQPQEEITRLHQDVEPLPEQGETARRQFERTPVQWLQPLLPEGPQVARRFVSMRPLLGRPYCVILNCPAVDLAKCIRCRAAAGVLRFVFNSAGIDQKVPSHNAIERSMLRLGVISLQEQPFEKLQRRAGSDYATGERSRAASGAAYSPMVSRSFAPLRLPVRPVRRLSLFQLQQDCAVAACSGTWYF